MARRKPVETEEQKVAETPADNAKVEYVQVNVKVPYKGTTHQQLRALDFFADLKNIDVVPAGIDAVYQQYREEYPDMPELSIFEESAE